jgi:hypothetical protein
MALDIRHELGVSRLQAENIQLGALVTVLLEENQRLQYLIIVLPFMRLPAELRMGI